MTEDAVLDTPVLDEVQAEPIEQVDQPEQSNPVESVAEPKGDERRIPAWARGLKETQPEVYKEVKGLLFGKLAYDEKLPGGVKELESLLGAVSERGGLEGLTQQFEELQASKSNLDGIFAAVAKSDPKLIDAIAEQNADAIPALAPAMLSKWSQVDPEGYGRAISGALMQTLSQTQTQGLFSEQPVPVTQMLTEATVAMQLGSPEQKAAIAEGVIQRITGMFGGLQQRASAPVQARPRQDESISRERQELEAQKTQMFTSDFDGARDAFLSDEITKALTDFIARKPKDDDAKATAIQSTMRDVRERMDKDAGFQKLLQGFKDRRDKDGALKLIKSRTPEIVKEIAPTWGRRLFGSGPAATPAKQAGNRVPPAATQVSRDPAGEILRRAMQR